MKRITIFKVVTAFVIAGVLVSAFFYSNKKTFYHTYQMKFDSKNDQNTQKVQNMLGVLGIKNENLSSKEPLNGVLCVSEAESVKTIDLYMPDMGHGAAPPKTNKTSRPAELVKNDLDQDKSVGCFELTGMQMFMSGLWQVRVFYNNGVIGLVDVTLDK